MSRLALESPRPAAVAVPELQKLSPGALRGGRRVEGGGEPGGFVAPLRGLAEAGPGGLGQAGVSHCQGVPSPGRVAPCSTGIFRASLGTLCHLLFLLVKAGRKLRVLPGTPQCRPHQTRPWPHRAGADHCCRPHV